MADFTFDGGAAAPVSQAHGGGRASFANMLGAVTSLALVIGVGIWGYGVVSRDVSGVPVVQAMGGPMRVAPDDPGGTLADHQGLAVNAVAGQGAAEGPVDQLILAPRPAGLAAEDVATGALVGQVSPRARPMEASLAQQAQVVELAPETPPIAEDDPILALAAELSANEAPLSPLLPGEDQPVVTSIQEVSSQEGGAPEVEGAADPVADAISDPVAEAIAEAVAAGPGLAVSLRPKLRPSGLQTAATTPVTAETVAAAVRGTTREVDPATLPAGTRLVQIGAFDSPETARSEWQRLETRFGEFLEGKGRVIQKASSGGRVFYRLRAEGFVDLSDARRFCSAFVAQQVDCIPVVTR